MKSAAGQQFNHDGGAEAEDPPRELPYDASRLRGSWAVPSFIRPCFLGDVGGRRERMPDRGGRGFGDGSGEEEEEEAFKHSKRGEGESN